MSLLKCHVEISECLKKYDRELDELLKIIRTQGQPATDDSYRIRYRDKNGNTGSVRLDLDEGFACLVDDINFTYDEKEDYILASMNGKNFYLRTDSFECPEIKIKKENKPLGDDGEQFLIIGVNERVISIISLDKSFELNVKLKGELPLDKIIDKVWKDHKEKK